MTPASTYGMITYTALGGEPVRTETATPKPWFSSLTTMFNSNDLTFSDTRLVVSNSATFSNNTTFFNATDVYFNALLPFHMAGDIVNLLLDYGYTKLDKSVKDFSHTNNTVTGVSETLYFGNVVTYHLQFDTISDVRGDGITSEVDVFNAMVDSALHGQVLTWYPSWTGSGNDPSFECALRKRSEPTRMGADSHLWSVVIELEVLPTMVLPSIPTFI